MVLSKKNKSIYVQEKHSDTDNVNTFEYVKRQKKGNFIHSIEDFFQNYYVKEAIDLPKKLVHWLVKLVPFFNLIYITVCLLLIFGQFDRSFVLEFLLPRKSNVFYFWLIHYIYTFFSLILLGTAARGLFKKYQGSWRLVFYFILWTTLCFILTFRFFEAFIFAFPISYIWFQLRREYAN
jgi:hypothetical protein